MHMLMMIGCVVLALLWGLARFVNIRAGRPISNPVLNGPRVFLPVWATISAANTYVGVTRAGYSLPTELLVHLVVFGLPAVAALVLMIRKV